MRAALLVAIDSRARWQKARFELDTIY